MKKKIVATGLSLGLVAGVGAGLVLQSSGLAGASTATPSVLVAATGTDSGETETDARPDHAARLAEVLQPLVDAGTITADQMAAVIDALEEAHPVGDREMGRGGHGGRGGEMGRGGHGDRRGPGAGVDAAAEALGIDIADLMTQLRSGATIAEIAEEAGIDIQGVIDAMLAEAQTHLDEHVAAGDLTQEEADARLQDMTERINDFVENGRPGRHGAEASTDDTGA
ncbi:MAG: hypothetical protein RI958_2602 [Actinomycetota bacterium]|jgi:polyhydroxyalkanoate synthesis regulator phasin